MNKLANKTVILVIMLTFALTGTAQQMVSDSQSVQMADGMRSNGKIYVVVAVLLTVLAGLFFYIINLDRRIGRLEKEANP
jgi:MFS superfamily sulfate permease-like transporter